MRITYRKLKPLDSEQYRIVRLKALKAYPEHFGSGYKEQIKLPKLYFQRLIEEKSSQGFMVGAFDKTDLIGICGITFETKLLASSGEIVQMYVKRDYQGKGIGSFLLQAVLKNLKRPDVQSVILGVLKSNASAISIYQKNGFNPEKQINPEKGIAYMSIKF